MFNWKKAKCKVCSAALPADPAILRVDTADGITELEVCNDCADFFEKSAEVLMKRNREEVEE